MAGEAQGVACIVGGVVNEIACCETGADQQQKTESKRQHSYDETVAKTCGNSGNGSVDHEPFTLRGAQSEGGSLVRERRQVS